MSPPAATNAAEAAILSSISQLPHFAYHSWRGRSRKKNCVPEQIDREQLFCEGTAFQSFKAVGVNCRDKADTAARSRKHRLRIGIVGNFVAYYVVGRQRADSRNNADISRTTAHHVRQYADLVPELTARNSGYLSALINECDLPAFAYYSADITEKCRFARVDSAANEQTAVKERFKLVSTANHASRDSEAYARDLSNDTVGVVYARNSRTNAVPDNEIPLTEFADMAMEGKMRDGVDCPADILRGTSDARCIIAARGQGVCGQKGYPVGKNDGKRLSEIESYLRNIAAYRADGTQQRSS